MTARSISKIAATVFAALTVLPTATPALAQQNQPYGTVTVPFAFEFGPSHLEAGKYEIATVANHVVSLRKANSMDRGVLLMMLQDGSARINPTGKVVFHRYGDTYFLSEVWQAGYSEHERAFLTNSEKQLRTKMLTNVAAKSPSSTGNTEVALTAK